MATPRNDSRGLRQLNDITQVQTLLAVHEHTIGATGKLYFKVHEEKDEWFVVTAKESLLAQTNQETTLYFLLAYNLPKSHQDGEGYQYFEITNEVLSSAHAQPGVHEALMIARHIDAISPRRRK